ncbi:hypothetical protein AA23498_0759 [Acetobacter nitrogenifigens DSM 23921 = NBRC 105050]|nr:hypothetical protein AA23498_0759 [Acetobacter nitrogenifigens DSM 23921 = NBRC 105050]
MPPQIYLPPPQGVSLGERAADTDEINISDYHVPYRGGCFVCNDCVLWPEPDDGAAQGEALDKPKPRISASGVDSAQ